MRFGLVYRAAWIYDMLLWILYRGRSRDRFCHVAEKIPPGSSVLDLCAGTAMLYRELHNRDVQYTAVDINPIPVNSLKRKGVHAVCADILKAEIPKADFVIMNSSLYHFWPNIEFIVKKMIASARERVIILEPVQNTADSRVSLLGRFAKWASMVDGVMPHFHFTPETFRETMQSIPGLVKIEELENGRDMLAVFTNMEKS